MYVDAVVFLSMYMMMIGRNGSQPYFQGPELYYKEIMKLILK